MPIIRIISHRTWFNIRVYIHQREWRIKEHSREWRQAQAGDHDTTNRAPLSTPLSTPIGSTTVSVPSLLSPPRSVTITEQAFTLSTMSHQLATITAITTMTMTPRQLTRPPTAIAWPFGQSLLVYVSDFYTIAPGWHHYPNLVPDISMLKTVHTIRWLKLFNINDGIRPCKSKWLGPSGSSEQLLGNFSSSFRDQHAPWDSKLRRDEFGLYWRTAINTMRCGTMQCVMFAAMLLLLFKDTLLRVMLLLVHWIPLAISTSDGMYQVMLEWIHQSKHRIVDRSMNCRRRPSPCERPIKYRRPPSSNDSVYPGRVCCRPRVRHCRTTPSASQHRHSRHCRAPCDGDRDKVSWNRNHASTGQASKRRRKKNKNTKSTKSVEIDMIQSTFE